MERIKMESPACASCRMQRKKCSRECLLAPHFPPNDPQKFAIVQRVFGRSNIFKMLHNVAAEQRRDLVNSMVFEATERVKDPVHGCTSAIHELNKQIAALESQLASTQAELQIMRSERDKLVSLLHIGSNDDSGNVSHAAGRISQLNEDNMLEDETALQLLDSPLQLWEEMSATQF